MLLNKMNSDIVSQSHSLQKQLCSTAVHPQKGDAIHIQGFPGFSQNLGVCQHLL